MSEITYTKDYSNTYVFWFNENLSTIELNVYSNHEFRFRDKNDVCEITLQSSETLDVNHLVFVIRNYKKKFTNFDERVVISNFLDAAVNWHPFNDPNYFEGPKFVKL